MGLAKIGLIMAFVFTLLTMYLSYKGIKQGTTTRENYKKIIIYGSIVIIFIIVITIMKLY